MEWKLIPITMWFINYLLDQTKQFQNALNMHYIGAKGFPSSIQQPATPIIAPDYHLAIIIPSYVNKLNAISYKISFNAQHSPMVIHSRPVCLFVQSGFPLAVAMLFFFLLFFPFRALPVTGSQFTVLLQNITLGIHSKLDLHSTMEMKLNCKYTVQNKLEWI